MGLQLENILEYFEIANKETTHILKKLVKNLRKG